MAVNTTAEPRELGIPVRAVFHSLLHPWRNAGDRGALLASMGQHAGGFLVLDIDPVTGRTVQYECRHPHAFEASASFRGRTNGHLWLGSCYTGWLHRFIPGNDAIEDIGPVDEEHATFPCRIDEAPDGAIWVGSFPGCCLSRYDPASGEWTRFGRMDETDMYFYPLCGADGTVAGVVRMCNVQVVALDPLTGEHRAIGPVAVTQDQSGDKVDLVKGVDGLLYIDATAGKFRVQSLEAVPVDEIPEQISPETLPDGSVAGFADASSFDHRKVRITSPTGDARMLDIAWEGAGTDIFILHEGPDGRLYGSSILPERLFSCLPDGSDMIDHGQCSVSGGEAYSMANLDGLVYIASYPAARLSIYDPAKPYSFGTGEGANPRDIGRVDDVAYRPRTMVAGPAGKVWVGSVPDYGMWGGTLASYDPATGALASHRHLIEDCSVTALTAVPGRERLLVGLAVSGGSGTQPRAKEAGFVLWDTDGDCAESTETFGLEPIEGVLDVLAIDERHAYATVCYLREETPGGPPTHAAELVLLDLANRCVVDRSALGGPYGWPSEVALVAGPDGAVYGTTSCSLYRIEPGTAQRQAIWQTSLEDEENHVRSAGPIIGSTFYFSTAHRLRAIDLPASAG